MNWVIYIVIFLGLRWTISRFRIPEEIGEKTYYSAFYLKVIFGIIYILFFTYYFSDGSIYGDTYRFIVDSKVLQSTAYSNFGVFAKLMTGIGELNINEVNLYLSDTQIWDYGNNGDIINDNRLILKINALLHFISFNNVYIHALCFSFISFCGTHLIYSAFSIYTKQKKKFYYVLLLWPSLAFWSSSILKETILFFGIGLFFFALFKLFEFKKNTLKHVIYLTIGIAILLFNKPYAGLFILAFSSVLILGHFFNWQKKGLYIFSFFIISTFAFLVVAPNQINLTQKISFKQKDLSNMGKGGIAFLSDSSFCVFPYSTLSNFNQIDKTKIKVLKETEGTYKLLGKSEFYTFTIQPSQEIYDVYLVYPPSNSYFENTLINNSKLQLLKNCPVALLNVLIRPFPWDNGDPLKIIVFILNLLLIFWFVYCLIYREKLDLKTQYVLYMLIGIALFITLIIGLTIPIFGAIVRYKVPVELFLIISIFILSKLKNEPKKIF